MNRNYIYWGLLGFTILLLFTTSDNETLVPTYPAIAFLGLLGLIAGDMWWASLKINSKAFICRLNKRLGHSTVHPDDIVHAFKYDKEGKRTKAFTCVACGGVCSSGLEWEGYDYFVIAPPEYFEDLGSALICHARLRRIPPSKVQPYILDSLGELRFFDPNSAKLKNNLYFGSTSNIDGTSTQENLIEEEKLLDYTEQVTYLKEIIKEYQDQINDMKPKFKDKIYTVVEDKETE